MDTLKAIFLNKRILTRSTKITWKVTFVGGSTAEIDGRVTSVEEGRVAKGVEVVELFVGGLAVEELEVDDSVVKGPGYEVNATD